MRRDPSARPRSGWTEDPGQAEYVKRVSPVDGLQPDLRLWVRRVNDGELTAMVGTNPNGTLHLSVAHRFHNHADRRRRGMPIGRYPTWDEIADARYELLPSELTFAMFLPPPSEYVAVHPTTFHLHELREDPRV